MLNLDDPDVLPFLSGTNPHARRVMNGNSIFLIRRISEDDFNERKAAALGTFAYFVHERAFLSRCNYSPRCV